MGRGSQNSLAPSHEKNTIRPTPRLSNRMSGAFSYLPIPCPASTVCLPTPHRMDAIPFAFPRSTQSIAPPACPLPACLPVRHRMRKEKRPASRVEKTWSENEPTNEKRGDGTGRGTERRRNDERRAASKRNGARCGKAADEMTPGTR